MKYFTLKSQGLSYSFGPNSGSTSSAGAIPRKRNFEENILQAYKKAAVKIYGFKTTEIVFPNHEGIYPRINFLQEADPKQVFESFNYGFLNLVYLSENLDEISLFPKGIKEAVLNFRKWKKHSDAVFSLKFSTAAPELCGEKIHNAVHIVQMGISSKKYKFEVPGFVEGLEFEEEEITAEWQSMRRAHGVFVLYTKLEKILAQNKAWVGKSDSHFLIFSNTSNNGIKKNHKHIIQSFKNKLYFNKLI